MPIQAARTAPHLSGRAWTLIGLLALIWAGSFPANRAALSEAGVLTTVAIRLCGGAVCLWGWILWRGVALPRSLRTWAALWTMGLLNNVFPFSLIVWGQTHIPSGLAAILNATTAIFTVLLAAVLLRDERLTPARLAGVLIGFCGMAVVVGPAALTAFDLSSAGQVAVLAAALSYALAGIFARKHLSGLDPVVSAAGMLSGAAAVMVPATLATEGVPGFDWSAYAWIALIYLGLMASALAYFLYYAVLRLAGAGNLSLVTLMIPPFAILLGSLFFGERLEASALGGFLLIAAGLLVIDGRIRLPRKSA
jgi:drug/metabolite transporter (DMT)-like permease